MEDKRTFWRLFTVVNVLAAAVTIVGVAYVKGLHDGQSRPAASQFESTAVVPNPHVGQGQHPVFDCQGMTAPVEAPDAGFTAIGELERKAGEAVVVRARVVQAFPRIMGVNWFHVCDAPGGKVLVASGNQWVPPGHVVTLRGVLSVDRNIGGAYVFPLYIENASLEGPAVELPTEAKPI